MSIKMPIIKPQPKQININDIDPKLQKEISCPKCPCVFWKEKIVWIKVDDESISSQPVYFNKVVYICEACGARLPEKP